VNPALDGHELPVAASFQFRKSQEETIGETDGLP